MVVSIYTGMDFFTTDFFLQDFLRHFRFFDFFGIIFIYGEYSNGHGTGKAVLQTSGSIMCGIF